MYEWWRSVPTSLDILVWSDTSRRVLRQIWNGSKFFRCLTHPVSLSQTVFVLALVCLCICNCIGLYLKLYLSLYLYLYLCSAVFQEFPPNVYSDILELFTSVNHLSKTGICSLKVSNIWVFKLYNSLKSKLIECAICLFITSRILLWLGLDRFFKLMGLLWQYGVIK